MECQGFDGKLKNYGEKNVLFLHRGRMLICYLMRHKKQMKLPYFLDHTQQLIIITNTVREIGIKQPMN